MKFLVCIARPAADGYERAEVGNFLVEAVTVSLSDPEVRPLIDDVLHVPVSLFPTNVARNKIIDLCQERRVDICFMADADSAPPAGWFKAAFLFLAGHHGPAVIGCPYVCGGPEQRVQVFEWQSPGNHAQTSFALKHVNREDAARRTGIQEVANVGTHCVAYKVSCFDVIDRPYYSYTFDAAQTEVLDTEEVSCHRRLHLAGVPVYVSWDHWSSHFKEERHDKPWLVGRDKVEQTYLEQAKA